MSAHPPGWMLDEVASAGRENLDAEHVSSYDSKEDAAAEEEVRFLQSHGLTGECVVVDLGTGTGQLALAVAPVCARVVAVDVSPVMLEALRVNVGQARLDNVEVVEAGFLSYQHQGQPADVVYSRYALHHLPDFWKAVALQRIHAILRPGGRFASGTSSTASLPPTQLTGSRPGARAHLRAAPDQSDRNITCRPTKPCSGWSKAPGTVVRISKPSDCHR